MSTKASLVSEGLSTEVVEQRQEEYGRNELVGKKPTSDLEFLLRQFRSPLVIVLMVAGLTTLFLDHVTDSIVIGVAVVINTFLGFIQERRAYRSLEALKKVLAPEAMVTRNGERATIDARDLVPGDVVWLFEGDKVPGDGVVIESADLLVREAVLTGESRPVEKKEYEGSLKMLVEDGRIADKVDDDRRVFMGTVVASGAGKFVVDHIGMRTEMGKIAVEVDEAGEEQTPLEKRLGQLARWLTIVVIVSAFVVFAYGLFTEQDPVEMFTVSVALAVAAIPEGLVVALTAILAIGMQRILKRRAVVRKLVAAETLGTVTTVCVDKTGTLTEGNMQVVETDFVSDELGLVCSTVANDRKDANELARFSWAKELLEGKDRRVEDIMEEYERDDEIAFSSERRFLAVRSGKNVFVSGAPEVVLLLSKGVSKGDAEALQKKIKKWGTMGRRMIGFAMKECKDEKESKDLVVQLRKISGEIGDDVKIGLKWVGVLALEDPLRGGVKEAFEKARKAGLEVKVITGDYKETAVAVMKRLGLEPNDDEVLLGSDLERMSADDLADVVGKVKLFARTRPTQKLAIVKALKFRGEVVGMMGDGVNDAPALAAADIGMVVGNATEVAREAADMVLLDSNFDTILAAVEEGRGIFDNLRKVILYLLSDTFSELIIVIGGLFMGWPLTISAAQILWVNLVNDGLPNLALTVDPKADDLLERKPLSLDASIFSGKMVVITFVVSIVSAIASLCMFGYAWPRYGEEVARSMVYALVAVDSLIYVFSCRLLVKGVWEESVFANKWLVAAVAGAAVLTAMALYIPVLQQLLELRPLSIEQWIVVWSLSSLVFFGSEIVKWVYRVRGWEE